MDFVDKPLFLLRTLTHKKIKKNWSAQQAIAFGETYEGLESIRNKDGFYTFVLDSIDESHKKKYGLATASTKSISKDSVKRFLDFEYKEGFNDKVKNAFAVFNGYSDYATFCESIIDKQKNTKSLKVYMVLGGIVFFSSLLFYFFTFGSKNKSKPNFKILNDDVISIDEPLKIKYDFGDFDYVKALFDINGQVNFPKTRKGLSELIMRTPGPKEVKLRMDDNVVASQKLLVTTKEWWGSINQTVPLLNNSYIHDGVLQLSANSYDYNIKEIYGDFQMHKNFGVSADNMIFETRVKNPEKNGSYGFDVSINLNGDANLMTFNLVDPNARIYNNMNIANTTFETPDQRALLMPFGVSLNEWKNVTVKTQNNVCTIYLDDKKVFEKAYSGNLGNLTGIQFYVKTHGSIDFVKVKNLNGKIVYEDDFLR